ncbi:Ionotropic receptor 75a [Frankliniella fusca]|uniref:Ionotropic receptor 75a n=1 Tax=Frankliniella fusca TaxID=407009 RepID=A0AAE1HTE4_9NEOP|nr:Ionotropic receptor 75a [Frankliniella fusca]
MSWKSQKFGLERAVYSLQGEYTVPGDCVLLHGDLCPQCTLTAVLCLLACTPRHCLEARVGRDVARAVFQHKGLKHVVAVLCHHAEPRGLDALQWERDLAGAGAMFVATPAPSGAQEVLRLLREATAAVGVFLQADCAEAKRVLHQCSAAGLLGGGGRHWLLAGNASATRAELLDLADGLVDLGPDSEVTLAPLSSDGRTVHLLDVYRARAGGPGPVRRQLTGTWTRAAGYASFRASTASSRRRDLDGTLLRAGVVVSGFRDADLPRVLGKPKDNAPLVPAVAAFSHTLVSHLQDALNITLRLQGGHYYALLRRLGRGSLDLLATATVMQPRYWDVLDYAGAPLWAERRVLVLRNPSALWSYDAWLRPLDARVWYILVTLVLCTAVVLRVVGYWEVRFDRGHVAEEDSWASAVTTALSIVCAQGFTTTTSWTSSRTLLLVFEFFSLFVNLFYSSGIVTFLLTFPPPFARDVRDMIRSPFVVGADRDVFSRANFTESSDALMRELYEKKMNESAGGGGFLGLREACDRARRGQFAVVGSPFPLYEMLAETWSQSDICRLQELPLLPPALLGLATAKRSPYRELISQGLLLLVERGQLARERLRWSVLRPRCALSDVTELDYVGLRQVTPLLGFVAGGLVLSLLILALELLTANSKYKDRDNPVMDLLKEVAKIHGKSRKKEA